MRWDFGQPVKWFGGTSTLYSIRIQSNWKKSDSIELINNDVRIFLLSLLERIYCDLSKWGELHERGSGWQAIYPPRHVSSSRNLSPRDHSSSLNIHMIRPFCDFQTKPKFNFEVAKYRRPSSYPYTGFDLRSWMQPFIWLSLCLPRRFRGIFINVLFFPSRYILSTSFHLA